MIVIDDSMRHITDSEPLIADFQLETFEMPCTILNRMAQMSVKQLVQC